MALQLTPVETRILGCLIEKERLTPENYPLSLNSLTLACNQSTSRDPVVNYDERTVEHALQDLRNKKLATMIWGAGARVQKFKHNFPDHYTLDRAETALLCVLMLRGPQTPGELRSRVERMSTFATAQDLESCLQKLTEGTEPLVRLVPARAGQKEKRYVQLISGEPLPEEAVVVDSTTAPISPYGPLDATRITALETEIGALKNEMAALRDEFAAFKKQFE
ncbi:MAG TPA: YceH family protein [Roseimicrobium sp.]|nr:YceH family protein [Roseimicrobium sp.]